MANIKISQLPAKGANLASTDLVEISEFNGSGYVSKSITGQEIIDAASGGSGVTDVTATSPIVSTGGTTPDISITQAGAATDGYLSTGDWNAFNNKQNALVSGVNIKTINGSSVLGSGDLAISGGLVGVHSLLFLPSASVTNQKITGSPTAVGTLLTANTIIAAPFIPAQNITTSNLFINVTTLFAGALCRIAIYSDVNGVPSNRLYLSSDLIMSSIGIKTSVTTFNFVAGTTYWLAIHGGTTGSSGVSSIQQSDLIPIKGQSIAGSFCLVTASATFTSGTPSTFPTPTFGFNNMPYIGITKA